MSNLAKTLNGALGPFTGLLPAMFGKEDQPAPGPTIITGPEPTKPRKTRMPSEGDPAMLEAAQRTRKAAMMRRGRASTIMTDNLRDTVGSSGQKLGA